MEISKPDISELKFKKQFFVAPSDFSHAGLNSWHSYKLHSTYNLFAHPSLSVSRAQQGDLHVLALGEILDPFHPEYSNADVVDALAKSSETLDHLEMNLGTLGGRWVLIAECDTEARVYHDAAGLKSIFFTVLKEGGTALASSAGLLCALGIAERQSEIFDEFESYYKNSGSWPVNIVPFKGVSQVLPNHFLQLHQAKVIRYWPKPGLHTNEPKDVIPDMFQLLSGLVSAANARYECAMNLTGGYDSRLLLAASKPYWARTSFFTYLRDDTPSHDITIPKKIRKMLGLRHEFVKPERVTKTGGLNIDELNRTLLSNVGGMYYDSSLQTNLSAWTRLLKEEPRAKLVVLEGLVSEVIRCYYYSNGNHPVELSGADLANRAGFGANPLAEKGFTEWLASVPSESNIALLDLLYWEHRLGVWGSAGTTCKEAVSELLPPMNCRRFLELGLSVSIAHRKAPYALIRALIGEGDRSLLKLEFNRDWVDVWKDRLKRSPVPWRVKKLLRCV